MARLVGAIGLRIAALIVLIEGRAPPLATSTATATATAGLAAVERSVMIVIATGGLVGVSDADEKCYGHSCDVS